jgi:2-oxoglutarate ferredoxin oxidoreductase subunit beta
LDELIEKAIMKRGFSIVEVITHCHTQYGRRNKMGGAIDMMRRQKEDAVRVEKAQAMSPEDLEGKITIGVLVDRELPVYIQEYNKIREAAAKAKGDTV